MKDSFLHELVQSNILAATEIKGEGHPGYQSALDPDQLTMQHVVDAIEQRGLNTMPFIHAHEIDALSDLLKFHLSCPVR